MHLQEATYQTYTNHALREDSGIEDQKFVRNCFSILINTDYKGCLWSIFSAGSVVVDFESDLRIFVAQEDDVCFSCLM